MNYFKEVKVLRIAKDCIEITWMDEHIKEVDVYLKENSNERLIKTVINTNKAIIENLDENIRNLFILKADGYVSELTGESLITLEGTHNFRDLGGFRSEDGRRVKWNTFFRADKLSSLSSKDIDIIKYIGVKTILDFRSKSEIKLNPDTNISDIEYINISAMPTIKEFGDNFDMNYILNESFAIDILKVEAIIMDSYKSMVFNNKAFAELVDCMENEHRTPIIFHCTSGKDRTGFAAALILSILGVPEEIIINDYIATNIYQKDISEKFINKIKKKVNNPDKIAMLNYAFNVKREFLEESFKSIKERYGSIDNYLEKEYGLTKKKKKELKNIYLY